MVPFVSAKPKSKSRRIEIKAEAKPSEVEIKSIIEANAKENRKSSDWDNVGFDTGNGITWVDTYRLKDNVSISRESETTFTARAVCVAIMKDRERYILPIYNANSQNVDFENLPGEQSYDFSSKA